MTEMVYKPTREPPKRLADGEYGGIHYYVLSLGAYPCAYIRLPDTCKNVETKDIDCHGGITYAGRTLATVEDEGFYIGWDYAHYGDHIGDMAGQIAFGRKWKTEEIVRECKDVIEQVLDLEDAPGGADCNGCAWLGKRKQKCSCCKRNRRMKDNYKGG